MSKFLKLNSSDLVKGLVMAVLSAILTLILSLLNANGLNFSMVELQQILIVALTAGASYLLKNLATNSNGELGKGERFQ